MTRNEQPPNQVGGRLPDGSRGQDSGYLERPDRGCEVSPSCLACPLERCKYDDPESYLLHLRQQADREKLAVIRTEWLTPAEAAERFGITQRTVYRLLARNNPPVKEEDDRCS